MQAKPSTYVLLFILFLFVIVGPAYTIYLHFDYQQVPDMRYYIQVASGNFNVGEIHRYRIIVPALAGLLSVPISKVYTDLWPQRSQEKWPLRLSFMIVNTIIMSITAVVLYMICREYGAQSLSSVFAVIFVMVSRFAVYLSGLPLVDSFYLLIVALVIYGIKARSTATLIITIFLGPFAKESFIFLVPLIFFFGNIPKKYQIILFLLSGLLVFGMRFYIDSIIEAEQTQSLSRIFAHFYNLNYSTSRIFSIKGLGELFSAFGILNLILLTGFFSGLTGIKKWSTHLDAPLLLLIPIIIVHILLSSDIARMAYFAAPTAAVIAAVIFDYHPVFEKVRSFIYENRMATNSNVDQANL